MCFTAKRIRKIKPWIRYLNDFFEEKRSLHNIKTDIKTAARLVGINHTRIEELTEKEINWLEKRGFIVEKNPQQGPYSNYYIVKW